MYYLFSNEMGYWDGNKYVSTKTNALPFASYELAFNHRYLYGLNNLSIVE